MRLIDRMGDRYSRLVVTGRLPNASATDTNARWQCRCDCGRLVTAYGQDLKKGKVKSCGCLNAQRITSHGMSRTKVYKTWKAMRSRCRNPKEPSYPNYGGRGISVCERWEDFEAFYADMGEQPPRGTIERIDNSLGYSKENCRWASHKEQAVNKRSNRVLTAFGRSQTISQWAEEIGVSWWTVRERVDRYGWPVEDAVSQSPRPGLALRKRAT